MNRFHHALVLVVGVAALAAGCKREMVSPPVATSAAKPDLVCNEQLTTDVSLSGNGFAPAIEKALTTPELVLPKVVLTRTAEINGEHATGTVTMPDDPTHPASSYLHWSSKQLMTLRVDPALQLAPGLYDITVTNPDGTHTATAKGALAAVPRPAVSLITPDLLCCAQEDKIVVLTGSHFLKVGATLPAVHVGTQTFPATKLDSCTPVPGTHAEGDVEECSSATFTVPKGSFEPGTYDVSLTNPSPANCVSSESIKLTIVPPPTVSTIVADLVCDAQGDQSMTVNGTGFLLLGTTLPKVMVGTQTFQATSADGCVANPATLAEGTASECTSLKFTLPKGALDAGDYAVSVTNPAPADCVSMEPVKLHVTPPPTLMNAAPVAVCDAQNDESVTLTGANFLQLGATLPTVTIGGMVVPASAPAGCAPVTGDFVEGAAQECTGLTVTVPKGTFAKGTYPVVVTNPTPAACTTMEMVGLTIDDPPTVTGTVPGTLCQGGGTLVLSGTNFQPSATVSLQAQGLATVNSASTSVNSMGTQLTAQMPRGGEPGDKYDLVVDNGDGCIDTTPHQQVTVVTGPVAFFADPDVVYNGINTRVTVYVTTLQQPLPASAVQIMPTGQAGPMTQLQWNSVPNHPNRVQAIIPQNQAPGVYDLVVNDATGCSTTLSQALTVTGSLTVSVKDVVAPFGYSGTATAVSIFRDTTAAAPANKTFVATPRVFLNPSNPKPTDIAISLASVSFTNEDTLTAVVPANEPANPYDLIVVNPDGSVGYLANAFTVQNVPPPTISSVTPSSLVQATGQVVTIAGQNFSSSQVSLSCKDGSGNAVAAPSVSANPEACGPGGGCTQKVTIDASGIPAGGLCVLRVTNADKSYFDYSALGVTNSSYNLSNPHYGSNLLVGRRGLVAASGNATAAARFVYAIGGDGGSATATDPFNSVESASVDLFGNMGNWQMQPSRLNTPRGFAAGVSVGRYLYVLGGTDGANALSSVERAEILDPAEAPYLDVDDIVPGATGLDAGYWIYRVSATFTSGDADNPGGESLPSDEIIVKVPTFNGKKIQVVLRWSAPVDNQGAALKNVAGYRVYRTPFVNGMSGKEVLIATPPSNALTFTDDGMSPPGVETPLPLGSTGHWAELPGMHVARKGPAAAFAFDPINTQKFYVYGLLGLDGSNNKVLTSYEYLPVTIQTNGHQTVGTWTNGLQQSLTGRWNLNAWVADSTVSSTITGSDTYVYLGGGLDASSNTVGKVEAGKVQIGGDLGLILDTPKDFSSAVAGYGVCAANNQLFAFGGGQPNAPSNKVISATLTSPQPSVANNSWNAGAQMKENRYALGSTVQSAFIFLIGGQTSSSEASTTTELMIW